ncbi:MAG: hypothetical protein H6Q67_446 [Firmicutes bacterium]|nr:hypothetical protein [Bacillota bacterium]
MITKIINIIQGNTQTIQLHNVTSESVRLGILLAIVGGFLDAYTFIGRDGVFANAQTGNIVLVAAGAAAGNWRQALLSIPPILAFIIGVIVAESLKKTSSFPFIKDSSRAVLIIEILVLFIIGFIPDTIPNLFATIAISFVSSLQISAFRKLVNSPYSTTMATGNLRSASQAAYIAFIKKDRAAAITSIRYFTIIFAFLFGAFLGGLITISIGIKAIFVAVFILIFSLILFIIDEHRLTSA